jgi:prepilin-type N-terminal cleavage/methylation domain-containing protein
MTAENPIQVINFHDAKTYRRRGFTLLEGLVASVVLAILVLGVVGSLTTSYAQSQIVRSNGTAVMLVRQLVDEMSAKPYSSSIALSPGAGTRSSFTSVNNYADYSDTSTSITTLNGGTLDATGADVYTRQVSAAYATPSIDTASPPNSFAIVNVTVTGPNGKSVTIPEFFANYTLTRP